MKPNLIEGMFQPPLGNGNSRHFQRMQDCREEAYLQCGRRSNTKGFLPMTSVPGGKLGPVIQRLIAYIAREAPIEFWVVTPRNRSRFNHSGLISASGLLSSRMMALGRGFLCMVRPGIT